MVLKWEDAVKKHLLTVINERQEKVREEVVIEQPVYNSNVPLTPVAKAALCNTNVNTERNATYISKVKRVSKFMKEQLDILNKMLSGQYQFEKQKKHDSDMHGQLSSLQSSLQNQRNKNHIKSRGMKVMEASQRQNQQDHEMQIEDGATQNKGANLSQGLGTGGNS